MECKKFIINGKKFDLIFTNTYSSLVVCYYYETRFKNILVRSLQVTFYLQEKKYLTKLNKISIAKLALKV